MKFTDTSPLLDRCARACHAAYRAERAGGKLHAPEDCPCRQHDLDTSGWCRRCHQRLALNDRQQVKGGCPNCDPLLRRFEDLTEAAQEHFREQARPTLAVVEPDAGVADRLAEAEARVAVFAEASIADPRDAEIVRLRADLANERTCSTCGGDPASHPSGLPCVCTVDHDEKAGTRNAEVQGLRLSFIKANAALAEDEAREAMLAEALRDLRAYVVAHVDVWASVVERADAALSALPARARALLDFVQAAKRVTNNLACTCDPPRPDCCTCGTVELLDALARLDAEPKP